MLKIVKTIYSTSVSSFRTKQQCNHAATAIEISTTLLLQINRIARGKKSIATGTKRGELAIERARARKGADWVHVAVVLYFKMGNLEKLISELFGTIWNETNLAGHLPNQRPTLPQHAQAIPRSAQQHASTSVYHSCSLVTTCRVWVV